MKMEQSEEERPRAAEATKRGTNINDVPSEILEIILKDYLLTSSSAELITLHTLGNNFARVVNHFLPKQRLRFNGSYTLSQEMLLHVLSSQSQPLNVDIEDCYWFNSCLVSRLITSIPLRKLHIMNFDLSYNNITNIIDLELSTLSIRWTSDWVLACKQTTDHSGSLWTTLTSVKVMFKDRKIISDFPTHFMRHCPNLKKIVTKVQDKIETCNAVRNYFVRPSDLENLFKSTPNILNISDFGKIIQEQTHAEINFDISPPPLKSSHFPKSEIKVRKNTANFYGFQISNENKYGCKKWKFYGLMPPNKCAKNAPELAMYITHYFGRIKGHFTALDLHKCQNLKLFPTGLLFLTQQFPYIQYLDITMQSTLLTEEDKELIIDSVCNLKYLKSLHMNVYFISFSGIRNLDVDRYKDITPNAIQKTSMFRLTTYCRTILILKLVGNINNDQIKKEYLYEAILAAIGNLEFLVELHLIDISTMGTGESLSLITRNCKELRKLQLKNVNFINKQNSIEEAVKYARNIRELSYYEKTKISEKIVYRYYKEIQLSEKLVHYLSRCPQLEKLSLENINVTCDQLEYLNNYLSTITSLHALRLVTKNNIKFPISVMQNLASINISKPAFLYLLKNQEKSSGFTIKIGSKKNLIHNLIDLKWPPNHQRLFQYSRSTY